MEKLIVECLRCGEPRLLLRALRQVEAHECARCGYLGWAESQTLTELERRVLRDRPLEKRRLRAA